MTRVVLTRVGLLTPAGVGLEPVRSALAGRPAEPRSHKEHAADHGPAQRTRAVPVRLRTLFDPPPPRLARLDRYPRLFLAAGLLALRGVELSEEEQLNCGVAVGSSFGCWGVDEQYHRGLLTRGPRLCSPLHFGYTVPGSAAGELSIAGRLRGPNATWVAGRASGLIALSEAARWIADGRCDRAVAGAADAMGGWLARELRDAGWPPDVAGEGAAALLLERADLAEEAGRVPLLELEPGRAWFDPSQDGDAWSPPAEIGPVAGAIGDCFSVDGIVQVLLARGPEQVERTGRCGHGASVTILSASGALLQAGDG